MTENPSDNRVPATGIGPRRAWRRVAGRTSPRFLVCVGILFLAALSMESLARYFEVTFHKDALPLKRPLAAMDTEKLAPEYRLTPIQFPPLSEDVIATLGTDEYLQWRLEDREKGRDDPAAMVTLFITYYTGEPDAVPHNPKECYVAGGSELLSEHRVTIEVDDSAGEQVAIPVNVLEFRPPSKGVTRLGGSSDPQVVAYFFYANGRYVITRTEVRLAVSNLWDRYAYYCKIEMVFGGKNGQRANREQTIAAVGRLLRKVMPILWQDHFQDWKALKEGAAPVVLDQ